MAEPSLEFLGKQIERLQVETRHARAEIAALRKRVDANEVRIRRSCPNQRVSRVCRSPFRGDGCPLRGDRRPLHASA